MEHGFMESLEKYKKTIQIWCVNTIYKKLAWVKPQIIYVINIF
jgi:hypothetical protein